MFFTVFIRSYGNNLIICKEYQISPLLYKRCYIIGSFLSELHFPTVVASHFVRLFKLTESSVSCQYDIDTGVYYRFKSREKAFKLFFFISPAVPPAEIFNAFLPCSITYTFYAKLFRPVYCINNKCLARTLRSYEFKLRKKELPARRLIETCNVHFFGAALGVNKQWVGKLRRKC